MLKAARSAGLTEPQASRVCKGARASGGAAVKGTVGELRLQGLDGFGVRVRV